MNQYIKLIIGIVAVVLVLGALYVLWSVGVQKGLINGYPASHSDTELLEGDRASSSEDEMLEMVNQITEGVTRSIEQKQAATKSQAVPTSVTPGTTVTSAPSSPTVPAVSAPKYPYTATVSFTGSRFVPDKAVIVEGGSIIFRNDSEDQDMWIASNFHPYHGAYPEKSKDDCAGSTFDQCASVGPGETWFFIFNETGKWYYHEENKPVVTAVVEVYSKEDYDKTF